MRRSLTTAVVALAALVIGGCAAPSGEPGAPRRDRNLIVAAEIEASDARNAYELVERLRPQWLNPNRGGTSLGGAGMVGIVVYHEQSRLGGVEALRNHPLGGIARIRFLDASTAAATLPGIGSGQVAGAIVIESR